MAMRYWIGLLTFYSQGLLADQFLIENFTTAEKLFWSKVYPGTHYSLYCGERFTSPSNMVIEQVYPLSYISEFLECGSVQKCRAESARFQRIEADLHNMYPAQSMIHAARDDFKFGLVSGEFREFFECDFEVDLATRLAEPRSVSRGNIARSLFYMHWEYALPLDSKFLGLYLQWHRDDPPSKDEKRRNDIIEQLQGTRNIFIDAPNNVDKLVGTLKLPAE